MLIALYCNRMTDIIRVNIYDDNIYSKGDFVTPVVATNGASSAS